MSPEEKLDHMLARLNETAIEMARLRSAQLHQTTLLTNWKGEIDSKIRRLDQKVDKVSGKVWQIMFWAGTAGLLGVGGFLLGCHFSC